MPDRTGGGEQRGDDCQDRGKEAHGRGQVRQGRILALARADQLILAVALSLLPLLSTQEISTSSPLAPPLNLNDR
jgi:hypothetical protein